MAKRSEFPDLSGDENVEREETTVANVSVSTTEAKASEEISEDALAGRRAQGVRIRFKDSGSISHVGWKLGEELVSRGRAEYVDD